MGHRAGVKTVRSTVRCARELGISVMTLYAFSQENWGRPPDEVGALMDLLVEYLRQELDEMLGNRISLRAIGDLQRLPEEARLVLKETIERTAGNSEMILNLALSYGGRSELARAARRLAEECLKGRLRPEEIDEDVLADRLYTSGLPDPDLLIRTSGEYRLSNFLLFQAAYSELYITPVLWPDFSREEFMKALEEYQKRERRFGLISQQHLSSCTARGS